MKKEWLPKTFEGRLFRLVEECGEVLQEIGKGGRFGWDIQYPPGAPTNAQSLLAELRDLQDAIVRIEPAILELAASEGRPPPGAPDVKSGPSVPPPSRRPASSGEMS